jgi:ribonuclease G
VPDTPVDIFIEVSPGETRAALLDEARRLCLLRLARLPNPSHLGGIYLGQVVKVEKGMGAAFVDIGFGEPAFLGRARTLHEGEALVVQVVRDAWGSKAASVVATPQLEGRYLAIGACRDEGPTVACDRTIAGTYLRAQLVDDVKNFAESSEAIRVRAAAVTVEASQLEREASRLRQRWQKIRNSATTGKPPQLLEPAPGLALRLMREVPAIHGIVIDDPRVYEDCVELAASEMPDLEGKITHFRDDTPLFRDQGIDEQVEEALVRSVTLPSGLTLTIDQTEALTAIDVDLGGAATRGRQEEECTRANLDAVPVIARQIILRNLAGLIVIDFISMRNKPNRRRVVEAMRKALRAGSDGAVDVLGMTAAGLVEVTRQRRGPALADFLTLRQPPVPNPVALACAALRDVLRTRGSGRPVLIADSDIIAVLEGSLSSALAETNRRLGEPLAFRREARRNGFEIILE